MTEESFSFKKFASGIVNWRNYVKLIVYALCALVLFSIVSTALRFIWPKKAQKSTSETKIKKIESGGVANITNINNPQFELKQGVYGRASTDRGSIGVFKEVHRNVDISIGGGRDWDQDNEFLEIETRFKF